MPERSCLSTASVRPKLASGIGLDRALLGFVALACLFGPNVSVGRAQTYLENVGVPNFTTQLPVEHGWVDASNGRLHLEIPLGSLPQRAGKSDNVVLMYDSNIWTISSNAWQPTNISVSSGTSASWGGWRLVTTADPGSVSWVRTPYGGGLCNGQRVPPGVEYGGFTWTAPDGTPHVFPVTTIDYVNACNHITQSTASGFSNDASGFHISVTNYTTAVIYGPDGTEINAPSKAGPEDSNGNSYSSVDMLKVSSIPLEVERRFSDPVRLESGCESSRKGENRRGETLSQQLAEEHHHDPQERYPGAGPFSDPEWSGAVADGGTDRAVPARRR